MDDVMGLIDRAHHGDERARAQLVEQNMGLVWSIVRRFSGRGTENEDLFQIGAIGLMKAIDKFNITIKRLFQYIIKHGEFEANSEVSALRADRLDSISRQIIEVIIPIIKQGNEDRKSTRLNSSHSQQSRMPSSA